MTLQSSNTASSSTTAVVPTSATLTLSGASTSNDSQTPQKPLQSQPAQTQHDEEEENIYDEIEIEDMTYDPALQIYHFPCPCGDRFEIGVADMRDGQDIAVCPSCSLMIRVIFEPEDLVKEEEKGKAGR